MSAAALLLLVEDEELVSELLEGALADAGFQVQAVRRGAEAIDVLEIRVAEFRGLITDINLWGGIDGWEVARRARELAEDLPVVYMTGDSESEWTSRGVPRSILVTKPFAPAQIVTAMASLLNTSAG